MARYLGPKCKLSRREGIDLMLKSASRPIEKKCRFKSLPGGNRRTGAGRKVDYLEHLREKQKLRRIYGVLERQFRRYYTNADKSAKATGIALLQTLEARLDNVVYRMGFAVTRAQARQMISHKLIKVGDKVVNIPSYQVVPSQEIVLTDKAKNLQIVKDSIVWAQTQIQPEWIEADYDNMRGTFVQLPLREQFAMEINENLIVEYYSK